MIDLVFGAGVAISGEAGEGGRVDGGLMGGMWAEGLAGLAFDVGWRSASTDGVRRLQPKRMFHVKHFCRDSRFGGG